MGWRLGKPGCDPTREAWRGGATIALQRAGLILGTRPSLCEPASKASWLLLSFSAAKPRRISSLTAAFSRRAKAMRLRLRMTTEWKGRAGGPAQDGAKRPLRT